jgi:branched-chain amino acid transport system substrate-binding protein
MRNRTRLLVTGLVATSLVTSMIGATSAATKKKTTKKTTKTTVTAAPTTVAATAAPATTAPPASTAAPAAAASADSQINLNGFSLGKDKIKIGASLILSGPFAFLGAFQRNSLQVEIDRINAAGGVGGAKLELVTRDDGGPAVTDAAKANNNAREFVNDPSMGLVIGPTISGTYGAVKGIFEEGKKVNCQAGVANDAGFGTSLRYAFRAQDAGTDVVPLTLKYLKEQKIGIVGLVYTNNATGKDYDKLIPASADKLGIIWAGTSFTQASDQTHAPQVKELLDVFKSRPELAPAIWIDNDANAAKTVAAAKAAGFKGIFVGGSGLGSYLIVDSGGDGMQDAIYEGPYQGALSRIPLDQQPKGYARHSAEVIKRFGYEKGTKQPVQQWAGTAIIADCIDLYATAVAKAKSTDSDKVVDAWESLKFNYGELPSGVPASYSKTDHETHEITDLYLWRWKKDDKGWYVEMARKADSAK